MAIYNITKFDGYTIDDNKIVRDSSNTIVDVISNKYGVPSVSLKMKNGFNTLMPIDTLYERRGSLVQENAAKNAKDPDMEEFLRQEREIWGPMCGDYSMIGNEYDMDLDGIPFGMIKTDDKSHYSYVSYDTWKAIEKKGTMDELFKYYNMGVAYFTKEDYIYINPYTGEAKMDMDFWYKYKDEPLFDRMLNSNRGGKKNREEEFKNIRHIDMNEILLDD